MTADFTIRLDRVFSGPMDLLLHLVREQEVEIHDIEITRILRGYLEYLQALTELDIERRSVPTPAPAAPVEPSLLPPP